MQWLEWVQTWVHSHQPLTRWLVFFLVATFLATVGRSFLKARKIQPNGFRWKTFRREIFFAALNLAITGFLIGGLTTALNKMGWIKFNHEPASGWVLALEFALYFFAFDCYFYWLHRLMHKEPIYKWVHKIHHGSMSPNLLTTLSVGPLESLINGGFMPIFTALFTMHDASFALMAPCTVFMGLYVHSGYEFLPRWWNKTWLTRWFITATFHDQHHRYFKGNYGGFTTIWDFLCGTVRSNYLSDFDKIKARTATAGRRLDSAVVVD